MFSAEMGRVEDAVEPLSAQLWLYYFIFMRLQYYDCHPHLHRLDMHFHVQDSFSAYLTKTVG